MGILVNVSKTVCGQPLAPINRVFLKIELRSSETKLFSVAFEISQIFRNMTDRQPEAKQKSASEYYKKQKTLKA